jgi:uncharacterized protein
MTHVPHGLHEEFPTSGAAITTLKIQDPHFARITDAYEAVNREIHLIESGLTPTSDETLEDFKKKRLRLKDEIAAMLRTAA